MSINNYEDTILEDAITIDEEMAAEPEKESIEIFGVVTDCLKLNIREEPDKDSCIVAVVSCLTELKIYSEMSTDDWYAVCTASGIEGYCMKKFVAIRQ